ncbi:MAG: sugar transferase [Lachnospiraceae bacterium]|jgi:exopolysaccharide biosynthesis polyprenyl glycosylphosphotransferase
MYSRKTTSGFRYWDFALIDAVLFAVSYCLAYLIRFSWQIKTYLTETAIRFGIIWLVIYILVAVIGGNYKNILRRGKWPELARTFIQIMLSLGVFLLYLYLIKQSDVLPRMMFGYLSIIALILIFSGRCAYKAILRKYYKNNDKLPHMLIVADKARAAASIASIRRHKYNEFFLSGIIIFGQDTAGGEIDGVPVVAGYDGLKEYILSNVVDEVLISIESVSEQTRLATTMLEAGIVVHIGIADEALVLPNAQTHLLGGRMVLTSSNNTASPLQLTVKRLFDILGGLAGIMITGVLYVFIAPRIKSVDPGPAIFKQVRIGKNGRRFSICKFRSMYLDAEEHKQELMEQNKMQGLMFKIDDDPRILPGIGHTIRRWSLDEFPQFWNVFKGDMSLVGTRPPTVDEFERYEAHHKSRLSFKPGITGLWQVSGRSDIVDFEEIVKLDNEYIRKWSLRLDLKILFKTVGVVLRRKGSG